MFLEVETVACTDYVLGYYLSIVKTVLTILQIAAPITLILSLAISFVKMVSSGEDKKITKGIFQKIIAVIIFFLLPWIVQLVLSLITIDDLDNGVQYTLGSCWENAEELRNSIDQAEDKSVDQGNHNTSLTPNTSNLSLNSMPIIFPTPKENKTDQEEKPTKLIFIGDSRTSGMKDAVNSNDIWSSKSSMGLSWMKSTGVPNVENQITQHSGVIILMGVNDLENVNQYASYINEKAKSWLQKGAKVYFISVMPTKGDKEEMNALINAFNKTIKKKLSSNINYIDTNSYLKKSGFDSLDGIHYTKSTYKKIYTYIKNHL